MPMTPNTRRRDRLRSHSGSYAVASPKRAAVTAHLGRCRRWRSSNSVIALVVGLCFVAGALTSPADSAGAGNVPRYVVPQPKKPESTPLQCVQYAPSVSPNYVSGAVLPLASDVLQAYRHAKPADQQSRATSEMADMSYRRVTEIDVESEVRSPRTHKLAEYAIEADFSPRGQLKPQDMVAVRIGEFSKPFKLPYSGQSGTYDFSLAKTTKEVEETNTEGLHWELSVSYNRRDTYDGFSTVPGGAEVDGRTVLSEPAFNAVNAQAQQVVGAAERSVPIGPEQDLARDYKLTWICP